MILHKINYSFKKENLYLHPVSVDNRDDVHIRLSLFLKFFHLIF